MALTQQAIFDRERLRTDPRPADHDESTFDFYNRCANEVIGSVRHLLDDVVGPHLFTELWERQGFLPNRSAEREHVAAVAIGTADQAHTVARRLPALYCNPAASLPSTKALRWPRITVSEQIVERMPGVDPAFLFGLTPDWPGDPWP